MSRKNRYAAPPFESWRGVPKELPKPWYTITANACSLGVRLWVLSADDNSGRIETEGPWEVWLCRQLRIEGKERHNAVRNMHELVAARCLIVGDDYVTVCIGQPLVGTPSEARSKDAAETQQAHSETAAGMQQVCSTESSNCNHSEPVGEKRGEDRRGEENLAAAAIPLSPDPLKVAATKGRQRLRAIDELQLDFDHRGRHEHALSVLSEKPTAEWAAAAAVIRRELEAGKRRYLTPQAIVDSWHMYSSGEAPGRKPLVSVKPEPTGVWAKAVVR